MPLHVYDLPFHMFNFLNSRLIAPAPEDALASELRDLQRTRNQTFIDAVPSLW